MGERDGRPDALSVELVDLADLPGKPTPPQQDIPPAAPREAVQPAPPSAGAPEQPKTSARPLDKETVDLLPLPGPPAKQSGTGADKKSTAKPQQQSDLQLQLSLPNPQMIPGNRGAAVARPPDITRSGENDEFGRGVIRALRQTMPSPTPRDWTGRVSIRLLLSETGNLAEVRLIRSGGDPYMDQSVVFAAKQSSFPIPPAASTPSDRTFLVTYIYH